MPLQVDAGNVVEETVPEGEVAVPPHALGGPDQAYDGVFEGGEGASEESWGPKDVVIGVYCDGSSDALHSFEKLSTLVCIWGGNDFDPRVDFLADSNSLYFFLVSDHRDDNSRWLVDEDGINAVDEFLPETAHCWDNDCNIFGSDSWIYWRRNRTRPQIV